MRQASLSVPTYPVSQFQISAQGLKEQIWKSRKSGLADFLHHYAVLSGSLFEVSYLASCSRVTLHLLYLGIQSAPILDRQSSSMTCSKPCGTLKIYPGGRVLLFVYTDAHSTVGIYSKLLLLQSRVSIINTCLLPSEFNACFQGIFSGISLYSL